MEGNRMCDPKKRHAADNTWVYDRKRGFVRQTKKQLRETAAYRKNSADSVLMWKGQYVEIVGNEDVKTSTGSVVLCAKIKIIGMPIEKALRLVPMEDLTKEKP
jgi:hypothetical protein